jgi:outer membrane protein assembly factor BamB
MTARKDSSRSGSRTARPTILKRPFLRLLLSLLLALAWQSQARAAEWPYYRGPNHDGVSTDCIQAQWPLPGPPEIWRRLLTNGFSSFAVSQARACTLETRGSSEQPQEVCLALNAETGAELWATPIGPAVYDDGSGEGDGPRSTPAIKDGRVFVLSAYLKLYCLSITNGQVLWCRDFMQELGAPNIWWQNAASPVLDGDLIFLNCNAADGTLAALRQSDGHIVWRTGTNLLTHSTPVPATLHGVRQVIFYTQSGLASLAATNGSVLWTYPFPFNYTTAAMSPVVWDDIVYCSATGSTGAGAVRITHEGDRFVATELWRKPGRLRNYWSTPVCLDGFLYGMFELDSGSPTRTLRCVDLQTGDVFWSQSGFGSGGILLVDGRLLILSETGELVLAETNPFAYLELARAQILSGKCWNIPGVSDSRLYARSTTEAVCLDLSDQTAPAPLVLAIQRPAGGPLRLRVSSSDGNPISPARLAAIKIHSAASLPPTGWSRLTNNLVLTNGSIEVAVEPSAAHRYFIAVEPLDSSASLVQSLQRRSDGHLLLHVSSADGNPIAPDRLAGIELLSTTNLLTPMTGWSCLTNSLTLSNGVIEVSLEPSGPQRYFIATEQL